MFYVGLQVALQGLKDPKLELPFENKINSQ
jgi:hypothetical protein